MVSEAGARARGGTWRYLRSALIRAARFRRALVGAGLPIVGNVHRSSLEGGGNRGAAGLRAGLQLVVGGGQDCCRCRSMILR